MTRDSTTIRSLDQAIDWFLGKTLNGSFSSNMAEEKNSLPSVLVLGGTGFIGRNLVCLAAVPCASSVKKRAKNIITSRQRCTLWSKFNELSKKLFLWHFWHELFNLTSVLIFWLAVCFKKQAWGGLLQGQTWLSLWMARTSVVEVVLGNSTLHSVKTPRSQKFVNHLEILEISKSSLRENQKKTNPLAPGALHFPFALT